MTNGDGISVGELARQVRDVLTRLEVLASRLETQFVRTDIFNLHREGVNAALAGMQEKTKTHDDSKVDKVSFTALETRVSQLEDERKWLIRLVFGFIILGVLGAVFAATGGAK